MLWCDLGACSLFKFWCVMDMVVSDLYNNCRHVSCMFVWFVCFWLGFHLFVDRCCVFLLIIVIILFIFCFVLCIVGFVIYSVVVRVIGWGRICVMFFWFVLMCI